MNKRENHNNRYVDHEMNLRPRHKRGHKSEDPAERESVAERLGQKPITRNALQVLSGLLKDRDYNVRIASIQSLLKVGNRSLLPKVIPLLRDKDELVRCAATEYVAEFGGLEGQKHLHRRLNDPNEVVRSLTGALLGRIGARKSVRHLERRLSIEKRNLAKVGLLEGLFMLGQSSRLEEMLHLLRTRSYRVRCSVANGLPALANRENKKQILAALVRAAKVEKTVAANSSIKGALRALKK